MSSMPAATVVLLLLGVGFSNPMSAQTPVSAGQTGFLPAISLPAAITRALQINPNSRVGALGVQYQQALSGSVRDIGKTNINLMYGQYNSPISYDNNITISQNISNPVYLKRLSQLAEANVNASQLQTRIYQSQIAYQVKTVYYGLLYRNEQRKLAVELTSLYKRVFKAAEIRFNSGETNILEKYNANTQLQQANAQVQQTAEYIRSTLEQLRQFTGDSTINDIQDTLLQEKVIGLNMDSALLVNNPQYQVLRSQIEVAAREIKVEKSKLLPDFSIGYFNQSLAGTYEQDGTQKYYGVGKRFQGAEAGIAIPLFSRPQKARVRAAEINQQIRQAELESFYFSLSQRGLTLLSELRRLNIQIAFYRNTAIPQANILISTSQRAFETGEIDYYQLSQSLNNAIEVRRQYIENLNQFNQAAIELELITGL